jgi:TolB protein
MNKQAAVTLLTLSWCVFAVVGRSNLRASATPNGVFGDHGDIGRVLHSGSLEYDPAHGTYTVSGSGENMWSTADAFHFVWRRVSDDIGLAADISFLGGGNEHRKAVLMVRQSLDADSVYADVALHGNGLTALQYRDETGAATHEIQTQEIHEYIPGPTRLRIEKRGDFVYLFSRDSAMDMHYSGASIRVPLQGTYYVGIGVCSHDKDAVEKAVFANVDLSGDLGPVGKTTLYSTLERVNIASNDRRVVYVASERFEAPNWTRDGASFLFNSKGRIYRLPVAGGEPTLIDTGFANRCNNDHGISPDQSSLAISDQSQEDNRSIVYIVPIGGGSPRRITAKSPSYWHGWSPDGKTLAFVGQRNDDFDIYTIPVTGGEETRLTTAKGLDDGPEYSPDGKYIYFNSERTGHMQIWRMRADGSEQEQVTVDDWNNWFPHISPDGAWMVFLSYEADVKGHPENKDVMLRVMSMSDRKVSVLAKLFGGQGTINVPSWSPDSKDVAFVSYALVADASVGKK